MPGRSGRRVAVDGLVRGLGLLRGVSLLKEKGFRLTGPLNAGTVTPRSDVAEVVNRMEAVLLLRPSLRIVLNTERP
jgi:hypothetical protein